MHNVLKWVESIALAGLGFEEGRVEEIVRASDVPDNFSESGVAPVLANIARPRIAALKELRRNWRDMDASEFRETLTTAHFTDYFTTAVSRAFYADYAYQTGDWAKFVYMDTAPDFRPVTRIRMSEPGTLYPRWEKGEAKASSIGATAITLSVKEYARQFDVSWRVIANDDLGKIRETPQRMARSASRFLGKFVSDSYDNATTQAALVALGALYAGTGRLTMANLAIGISAMMTRTDAASNPIGVQRVYLVIPPILKVQAAQILQDLIAYGGPDSNVLGQFIAGVIVDPYIATSGPDVPWYLVADPAEIPTVTLMRLAGMSGPVVAMKASNIQLIQGNAPAAFLMGSFETGDIEYLVEDVVGAGASATLVGVTDVQGIYYSSGTTA